MKTKKQLTDALGELVTMILLYILGSSGVVFFRTYHWVNKQNSYVFLKSTYYILLAMIILVSILYIRRACKNQGLSCNLLVEKITIIFLVLFSAQQQYISFVFWGSHPKTLQDALCLEAEALIYLKEDVFFHALFLIYLLVYGCAFVWKKIDTLDMDEESTDQSKSLTIINNFFIFKSSTRENINKNEIEEKD